MIKIIVVDDKLKIYVKWQIPPPLAKLENVRMSIFVPSYFFHQIVENHFVYNFSCVNQDRLQRFQLNCSSTFLF